MPRMRCLIMCYRLLASLFSMSSLTHSLVLYLESFADGSLQSFQPSDWYHCAPSSLFGLVHTLIPTVADSIAKHCNYNVQFDCFRSNVK